MDTRDTKELKKYRDSFIIHALLGLCGVAAAVYVYKYTGYLSGIAEGYVYICSLDMRELFARYYSEVRYLVLLFAAGFTIYAVPLAIVFSVLRGFVCAVGILRLAETVRLGGLTQVHFVMTAVSMAFVFVIELIMAAKTARHGSHLQYIVPRTGDLLRDRVTLRYAAAFAMLCGFLFMAVALVYFAPLLPF